MNRVYITQAKVITALGPDLDSLFNGLMDQKSGIDKITRFNTQLYVSSYAGSVQSLNHLEKTPLILQLSDMLIEQLGDIPPDTFLITASTKGGIEILEKNIARSNSIPKELLLSGLTKYIALKSGLKNRGININCACASSTVAVAKAASLIAKGIVDSALICCMDVITPFVFSGFSSLGAMSDEPARPFDNKRKGLTLGEGAAAIILMNKQKAKALGQPLLGEIAGWGIANDATHLTAPAKDGKGLKRAIETACKKAKILLHDIHAINTHGTGTRYNDAMELNLINKMFQPKKIIANSIKGAIGHTLGAAGGIEIALCLKMLKEKMVPGTSGFVQSENESQTIISPDPRPFKGDCILTTNSGFGGINAAMILQAPYHRE